MYRKTRGFMKDMDKNELLKMREGGMSNAAIAASLGCSQSAVYNILGPMPKEMRSRIARETGARGGRAKWSNQTEGGYTVERKMKSFMHASEVLEQPEQEQAAAVLAVKRAPIMLSGQFMDYVVSADSKSVEVEKEGRVLMQIPAENLVTFIKELAAISRNIGEQKPMQFWG